MQITGEQLAKTYTFGHGNSVPALRAVSFSVQSGETVAIVGPSGAGKSTLLHLLGLMDQPSHGRLLLDGTDYSAVPEYARADVRKARIGFLFQMHYLLPEFTVWENVLVPVWERRQEKESTARQLLESLGLSARLQHLPAELSGGEQQRVALARALINDPGLLLADEPTGNLDRETGEQVETLLFAECARRSATLILVTHNPDLAARASRTISMRDGRILAD